MIVSANKMISQYFFMVINNMAARFLVYVNGGITSLHISAAYNYKNLLVVREYDSTDIHVKSSDSAVISSFFSLTFWIEASPLVRLLIIQYLSCKIT